MCVRHSEHVVQRIAVQLNVPSGGDSIDRGGIFSEKSQSLDADCTDLRHSVGIHVIQNRRHHSVPLCSNVEVLWIFEKHG